MKPSLFLIPVCLAVLLDGCARTERAKDVQVSGFLAEYHSLLRKGGKQEPMLTYRKPGTDWAAYHQILLDPVTIWQGPVSQLKGIPPEDLQRFADDFYILLYNKLSNDYAMVNQPAPKTLRMQIAMTQVEQAWTAPSVISKVVPQVRLLSTIKDYTTGKPAFVGEASFEVKVFDAHTGELLGATADHRVGGKSINAESFNSWGDVYQIIQFWVDGTSYRLAQLRKDSKIPSPKP